MIKIQLFHALFWAALMILSSLAWKNAPEDLLLWLIAGYVASNGFLMALLAKNKSD